jgi:hypothetical protein
MAFVPIIAGSPAILDEEWYSCKKIALVSGSSPAMKRAYAK